MTGMKIACATPRPTRRRHLRQLRFEVDPLAAHLSALARWSGDFSDPDASALSQRLSPELVEEIKEGLAADASWSGIWS
jgi:hypothetical protein